MSVKEVLRLGHPVLRKVADQVAPDDFRTLEFANLIQDLRETLVEQGGIGLAAPQIGVSLRVAIIEIEAGPTRYGELEAMPLTVFVNPQVKVLSSDTAGYWEGCLSVPGMRGFVERPQHILVNYLDAEAVSETIELTGFLATVFQHEFDHLDGKLYVDHIRDMRQFAYEPEFERFVAPQLDQG